MIRPAFSALLASCLLLAACATVGPSTESNPMIPETSSSAVLRPGDSLEIALQGIPDASSNSIQIDEQGLITLPYIGNVQAAGASTAELSQRIRETYIAMRIYTAVTASVRVTERYVYVGGEVASPGRIIWTPDLTAAKAIQAAGGFTLYARETAVTLSREGQAYAIDIRLAMRNPGEDRRLMPGDSLQVARSPF
jgi:protein involved in polysaccharide export with SLBB domain